MEKEVSDDIATKILGLLFGVRAHRARAEEKKPARRGRRKAPCPIIFVWKPFISEGVFGGAKFYIRSRGSI